MSGGGGQNPVLDSVLDGLAEAIVWHQTGRVIWLNRAAETLFNVSVAQAQGRLLIEVLRDHRLERAALLRQETEMEVDSRFLLVRGMPEGLILRDVTAQRQQERELRETVMVLAHEFRTPVTAIKSLFEALAVVDEEELRQNFVALGLRESERLVRLVEDLAVEFRPRAERTFRFDEAVERAAHLTRDEFARRGVRLEISGAEMLVHCDPDKLVQVLVNLIENAVRHGPNPGQIRLTACPEGAGGARTVTVRLTDQGKRLHDYQGIFGRQVQGSASRGSGLGLYIVQRLVEQWQGRVWGQFTGQGNEFGFTVPGVPDMPSPGGSGDHAEQ